MNAVVVTDEATLRSLVAEEVARAVGSVRDALATSRGGVRATDGDDTLMTAEEVAALLRVDRRTLRRMELAGDIPSAIEINERTKRWRRTAIEKWLRSKEQRS